MNTTEVTNQASADFITAKLAERKNCADKSQLIAAGMTPLWTDLCERTTAIADAYCEQTGQAKVTPRVTAEMYTLNFGANLHRSVALDQIAASALDLYLDSKSGCISGGAVKFQIDVPAGTNEAALTLAGQPISTQAAAEKLMGAILFPDLR